MSSFRTRMKLRVTWTPCSKSLILIRINKWHTVKSYNYCPISWYHRILKWSISLLSSNISMSKWTHLYKHPRIWWMTILTLTIMETISTRKITIRIKSLYLFLRSSLITKALRPWLLFNNRVTEPTRRMYCQIGLKSMEQMRITTRPSLIGLKIRYRTRRRTTWWRWINKCLLTRSSTWINRTLTKGSIWEMTITSEQQRPATWLTTQKSKWIPPPISFQIAN